MLELQWKGERLRADFYIPNDEHSVLRVEFERSEIVRILDEMPLSTEGSEPDSFECHVPEHFAYRVEGAWSWVAQSEAFKATFRTSQHYLFVTGCTCLDVISIEPPRLSIVEREFSKGDLLAE